MDALKIIFNYITENIELIGILAGLALIVIFGLIVVGLQMQIKDKIDDATIVIYQNKQKEGKPLVIKKGILKKEKKKPSKPLPLEIMINKFKPNKEGE